MVSRSDRGVVAAAHVCSVIALVFLPAATAHAQGAYRISDLGALPGAGLVSAANAINDRGDVAGYGLIQSTQRAMLWSRGTAQDLGNVGPGIPGELRFTEALGINNRGQVVGQGVTRSGDTLITRGFVWNKGVMTQLDGPDAAGLTAANAINDAGHVAGLAQVGSYRAAMWIDGKVSLIGPVDGTSWASDINASDRVAGSTLGYTGMPSAFVWQAGSLSQLAPLEAGYGAYAMALNDRGQVVGTSDSSSNTFQAVLWNDGQAVRLPGTEGTFESVAKDISNAGRIVGYKRAGSPFGDVTAMLWQDGQGYDMNLLEGVAGSGWRLQAAADINEAGMIVGYGMSPDGKSHAFLLTPVPEPATAALLLGGLALLGARTRKTRRARRAARFSRIGRQRRIAAWSRTSDSIPPSPAGCARALASRPTRRRAPGPRPRSAAMR